MMSSIVLSLVAFWVCTLHIFPPPTQLLSITSLSRYSKYMYRMLGNDYARFMQFYASSFLSCLLALVESQIAYVSFRIRNDMMSYFYFDGTFFWVLGQTAMIITVVTCMEETGGSCVTEIFDPCLATEPFFHQLFNSNNI
ncbi:hypothetical protein BDQ17DRAFT_327401 [Cyathus striatus]|nr:hypothetical protein BDQ17DRAFT_327401 [Cyathus striatus]